MYRCYHSGKFVSFLLADIVILVIFLLGTNVVKAIMPDEKKPDGIFLPVIMYHSVTSPVVGDYHVSPEMLENDLQYLKNHGYQSVTSSQLLDYTQGKGKLPEHPIMITFDDGFYNNLSQALPLLEKYDMCAVVSIVGYYTDVTAERDPHVDTYSYLTWDDVKQLQNSGRVEIGSHTYNMHSNSERAGCSILYGENPEHYQMILRDDLSLLQDQAKKQTGTAPTIFAYPYGFTCRESVPVLKELGFTCTLICLEKPNYITRNSDCLYGLCRYNRSPDLSTEDFFKKALAE